LIVILWLRGPLDCPQPHSVAKLGRGQKNSDYLLFKQAIDLLNRKAHLELEGIKQILSIKAVLNKGLSDALRLEFPNLLPETRPIVSSDVVIPHPNWLTGFVDGEGCFYALVSPAKGYSTGMRVRLTFYITRAPALPRTA